MLQKESVLYSRLADDADLRDIVRLFVEEMPGRTATLRDCLDRGDWEGVGHIVHQLKGAAGSHGFDAISSCAGRVESALRDREPDEHSREAVLELVDLCGRVRNK